MASNRRANYHSNCHENRERTRRRSTNERRRGFAEDIKLKLIAIVPPVIRRRAAVVWSDRTSHSKRVHVDGVHTGVHVGHTVSAGLTEHSHVDRFVVQLL